MDHNMEQVYGEDLVRGIPRRSTRRSRRNRHANRINAEPQNVPSQLSDNLNFDIEPIQEASNLSTNRLASRSIDTPMKSQSGTLIQVTPKLFHKYRENGLELNSEVNINRTPSNLSARSTDPLMRSQSGTLIQVTPKLAHKYRDNDIELNSEPQRPESRLGNNNRTVDIRNFAMQSYSDINEASINRDFYASSYNININKAPPMTSSMIANLDATKIKDLDNTMEMSYVVSFEMFGKSLLGS